MKNYSTPPEWHFAFPMFLPFLGSLLLSSLISFLPAHAQLSGTYTIGGTDGDFASFTEVAIALESEGTSGPVIFKIRPGVYRGGFYLREPYQHLTFEGESSDSTQVVLENDGGHAVFIEGGWDYTFRRMTLSGRGSAVHILKGKEYGTSDILLENNILKGGEGNAVIQVYEEGLGFNHHMHIYRNNLIIGQGPGIKKTKDTHEDRYGDGRSTDYGLEISGNIIQAEGVGIHLYAQEYVKINDNQISVREKDDSSFAQGISLSYLYRFNELNQNQVTVRGTGAKGITIWGAHLPVRMLQNRVHLSDGGTGIAFEPSFDLWELPSLVANNMVFVKGNRNSIGILINNSHGKPAFIHNSVLIYGEDVTSKALSLFQGYSFYKADLLNNIFANKAGGYAVHVEVEYYEDHGFTPVNASDYNDFYTNGEVFAHWIEDDIQSFSEWQSVTGFDFHSLIQDPQFDSNQMLIPANPALIGAGIAMEGVTTDFYGELRSDPPDIGAVEFELGHEKPEPSLGFVVGGAVFHSPAGAIADNFLVEGKSILSFHANQKRGEERPKGVASLTIPQADFRFQSNNAYEWMAVEDHKAIMEGTGVLNREAGYRFVISVVDLGTGSRDPKDTYRMIIWNPGGEVVYDNQPGLQTYATATMPIERGDILVGREITPNAQMSIAPSSGAIIHEFKAFPTKLDQEGLWLEIPDHKLLGTEKYRFSILDRQGRVMTEGLLSSAGKHQLKLKSEQWAPGIYLLVIRGEGFQYQQKMVK